MEKLMEETDGGNQEKRLMEEIEQESYE